MKNRILTVLMMACFALLVTAAPRLGTMDIPELPMADGSGDTPELIVKMLPSNAAMKQMSELKLSSLRGKVTLLDMFWSQCPHCEEHAPHVAEWFTKYKSRGLNIVGLATDKEEESAKVRAFMAKAKTNYPIGFLNNMVIAYYADSHDHGVPQMVLFGTDGKMVKRTIGWREDVGKEMIKAIEEQLAKAGSTTETAAPVKPGSKATAKPTTRKTKIA
ncbi:MAG: TlpA family protein disulfide reductase [Acidobacteria bacterium]|nr:TlpA family protein disulfide reductase [Acidobacteriota bacterium]